jgi:hypothetical protein
VTSYKFPLVAGPGSGTLNDALTIAVPHEGPAMFRHVCCLAVLFLGTNAHAADREVRGTIVVVDLEDRSVVVEQETGRKTECVIGANSKVHDSRGVSKSGFRDARLHAGTTVRVILPEKGNTIKQLHILAAGPAGMPRPEAQGGAARGKPPGQVKAGGFAPARAGDDAARDGDKAARVPDELKRDPKKADDEKPHQPKGELARILRIDKAKRTIEVEFVETKRKATFTLESGVEFVSPRGGVSDAEFEDDRFIVGNQVRLELSEDGDAVVRIHLPFRNRARGDK